MSVVFWTAALVVLWAFATRSCSVLRDTLARLAPSVVSVRFAACALVPLYAAQLALVAAESRLQGRLASFAWVRLLPIPVIDDRFPQQTSYALLEIGIAVVETIALATILLSLRRTGTIERRLFGVIACVLATLSMLAPAMSTTDPYEYVATGILGFHAYAPAHGAFVGTIYESLQKLVRLTGVIYGPLWLVVDVAQTHFGTSVFQKIEALRITNVGLVGLLVWLLARTGARSATPCFALNPALWFYAVANPHADIQGLVLLTAAYGFARRSNATASVLLVIAAGLIKLPFVLVGGVVFAPLTGFVRRFALWFVAVTAALTISYLVPGPAYLVEISHYAGRRAGGDSSYLFALGLSIFVAGACIALALSKRYYFGAAWFFAHIAIVGFPWYLLWGIPYALVTGTLDVYLVLLPLGTALLGLKGQFNSTYVVLAVALALVADVLLSRRRALAGP